LSSIIAKTCKAGTIPHKIKSGGKRWPPFRAVFMKSVLMLLLLAAGSGLASADPYVYTVTGTASGFYLPGTTYDGYFGYRPDGVEPVAFADQPFLLTLDTGEIGVNWVETQAAISIGAQTGAVTLNSVLSTLDHSNVDFSIAYLWYSAGKAITVHPQVPGFDGQGPFNVGDTVGSEPVAVNLWLFSDGFGQVIPTTFGMVRLSSIDDATFTAAVTAAPEPGCAALVLIGGMMLWLFSARSPRHELIPARLIERRKLAVQIIQRRFQLLAVSLVGRRFQIMKDSRPRELQAALLGFELNLLGARGWKAYGLPAGGRFLHLGLDRLTFPATGHPLPVSYIRAETE
jgi:hypothetical protein